MNGSDMDSDSIYTTNQKDIVAHAKYCCDNYLTIVNNIPKEKNIYSNTLYDYAKIDNATSASQLTIGESSNLAQVCLSYSYNYDDQKYEDYCCILSVLAQVSIDNAKRKFDIDLSSEIKRIKNDMDIKENKYPSFWKTIRKDFNVDNINKDLVCPMNCLSEVKVQSYVKPAQSTLPMSHFFNSQKYKFSKRQCKKVEDLILKYGFKVNRYNMNLKPNNEDDTLLIRSDFEELIEDIRSTSISKNYTGLMMWLIDRAFLITPQIRSNRNTIKSKLNKNKSLLLNTLFTANPDCFLECFRKADSNGQLDV